MKIFVSHVLYIYAFFSTYLFVYIYLVLCSFVKFYEVKFVAHVIIICLLVVYLMMLSVVETVWHQLVV
jgi:hypothetical protein